MIAFVVFLLVKAYNKANKPAPAEEAGPSEVDLLTEIRDALAGRYGARWALTPNRHLVYYYCAVPIVADGAVIGAVVATRSATAATISSTDRTTVGDRFTLDCEPPTICM